MQNAFIPLPFPLNLTLLYSIFVPTIIALILALALAVNRPLSGKTSGFLAALALLIPLLLFANHLLLMFLANVYPSIYTFTAVSETYNWISFGTTTIDFGLLADELSLPFVSLIAFVSFLATVYSIGYMKHEKNLSAYYVFIILFAASMFGAVLSTNLIQFFIFYEAMNFPAFFLVLIWGTRKGKRTSLQYIFYMFTGALCLLGGIVWLFGYTGSLDILQLPSIITSIGLPFEVAAVIALLMFIGFGTKMAVFPFHNWLPNFHAEAPSSISALLSAVMIEIGLYG
ncbi:MAG: complex I subunit 5 family protein, partial [Candidatus Ranarchaeia archaeon]